MRRRLVFIFPIKSVYIRTSYWQNWCNRWGRRTWWRRDLTKTEWGMIAQDEEATTGNWTWKACARQSIMNVREISSALHFESTWQFDCVFQFWQNIRSLTYWLRLTHPISSNTFRERNSWVPSSSRRDGNEEKWDRFRSWRCLQASATDTSSGPFSQLHVRNSRYLGDPFDLWTAPMTFHLNVTLDLKKKSSVSGTKSSSFVFR